MILKEDQSVSVLEHKQVIVQSLDDFKGKLAQNKTINHLFVMQHNIW